MQYGIYTGVLVSGGLRPAAAVIPAGTPVRNGCVFLGWAKTRDAAEPEYQPGDEYSYTESSLMDGGDLKTFTLYAVWREDSVIGDITGDGTVDVRDLIRLLKYVNGEAVTLRGSGDVTGDGAIDLADVLRLMKYLVGAIPSLP